MKNKQYEYEFELGYFFSFADPVIQRLIRNT